MPDTPDPRPSRRIVFHGLGALGVAAVLAGCGRAADDSATDGVDSGSGGTGDGDAGAAPGAAGTTLVATADVPVNGGVILTDQRVVVTQPSEGQFKAFTAVCTHQGNLVTSVGGGTIVCNHHGSMYSASTGAVEGGPAPSPLAPVAIAVQGGNVVTA